MNREKRSTRKRKGTDTEDPPAVRKPKQQRQQQPPPQQRSATSPSLSTSSSSTSLNEDATIIEFLGNGEVKADGSKHYQAVRVTNSEGSFTVNLNDCVVLYSDEKWRADWVCRVEDLFRQGDVDKFTGRWFFSRQDIRADTKGMKYHPAERALLDGMGPKELALSDFSDSNEIETIRARCSVRWISPDSKVSPVLDSTEFVCRYKLEINDAKREVSVMDCPEQEFGGDGDVTVVDSLVSDIEDDYDDEGSDTSDGPRRKVIAEGEGSKVRGDIGIGPNFQVHVPRFTPNQQLVSRNPVLVWKPGCISEEKLQSFLDRLSTMHTSYLELNGLDASVRRRPVLDHTCTAEQELLSTASMITNRQTGLLKECDADAILKILADHKWDSVACLRTITKDLDIISGPWSRAEIEIFDDNFRRYNGSLTAIGRSIAPTKSMRDVVDYHFRFQIPHQFRHFQEKKREQVIRMMTLVEEKKGRDMISQSKGGSKESVPSKVHGTNVHHWSETAVSDTVGAMEKRREAARELLLDVLDVMGRESMVEIASVLRRLNESYSPEGKAKLFRLLEGQRLLQDRFLEFLPKHF